MIFYNKNIICQIFLDKKIAEIIFFLIIKANMSSFDTLFFEQHISEEETIQKVFHRHIFVMIEDLIIWIFFGLIIPAFLYFFDVFSIKTLTDPTWIYAYLFLIYFILLYKLFDWYLDVWIMTNKTLVDMRWKWLTPQLLYIAYDKIESIEVRTQSWLYSMVGISDVRIHLAGEEFHTLTSASHPKEVVQFLQDKLKNDNKEKNSEEKEKEPFDVLVDTLSGVVKDHLSTHGKNYLTKDYVEQLDSTLSYGIPIDLRSQEEKIIIEKWKDRHLSKKQKDSSLNPDS